MGRTSKDNQRAYYFKALGKHLGTWTLRGHLEWNLGTSALKTLGHSDTYGTQALRHLSTQILGHLGT